MGSFIYDWEQKRLGTGFFANVNYEDMSPFSLWLLDHKEFQCLWIEVEISLPFQFCFWSWVLINIWNSKMETFEGTIYKVTRNNAILFKQSV